MFKEEELSFGSLSGAVRLQASHFLSCLHPQNQVALSNNTIVNTPPLRAGEQAATTTVVEHIRAIVADMVKVRVCLFASLS